MTDATSDIAVTLDGQVLTVTFDRPSRHNALTLEMYGAVHDACERADSDEDVGALVVRGTGGKAFASGTDISVFSDFEDGSAGVAYEASVTRVVNRLEEVTVPTVAAVQGFCLGGGLVLAAACDVRVATASARFGVPVARTLGNCLSANSVSLLSSRLGSGRVLDLLLRARMLTAQEALAAGFVAEVCDEDALQESVGREVSTLLSHAPLTMWATKAVVARQRRAAVVDADDIVARAFGSEDFRAAVAGFGSRRAPDWQGR